MNRQMEKIGVDILPKPMVLILGTGSELETLTAVVGLARPVKGEAEGSLHPAGRADMGECPARILGSAEASGRLKDYVPERGRRRKVILIDIVPDSE